MTSWIASGDGASSTTETVAEAARGDAGAFALLCHAQAPGVAAYIGARCSDEDERDELVRLVFAQAWRELPSLDDARRFNLWLLRLAHNVSGGAVRDHRTKSNNRPSSYVAAELFALPKSLREAIGMRYFFGSSEEEIAVAFDEPIDEVRRWIRAGLESLSSAAGPSAALRAA